MKPAANGPIRITFFAAFAAGLAPAQRATAQPPPNDNCSGAQLIACGASVTFSNAAATDVPTDPPFSCGFFGAANGFGSMWYRFVATNTSAMLTTCGSPQVRDTLLGVYSINPANPCGSLVEIGCNDDAGCGANGTLSRVCATDLVPGRTYYVQVAGASAIDRGQITLALACPCVGNDACQGALAVACNSSTISSNVDASDSATDPVYQCSGIPGSGTIWFRFTAGATSALVSICDDTQIRDSILAVYSVGNANDPCHSLTQIACNDDGCGLDDQLRSHVCVQGLTPGATYYAEVAGFNPGDRGMVTLAVTCPCAPTCVTCPTGAQMENEPTCFDGYVDQFDGGCGSNPPVFVPIACGQRFCGASGTFMNAGGTSRDTDWYEFTLGQEGPVSVNVTAEFPVHVIFVDPNPDCTSRIVQAIGTARPCQPATVSACLTAGTHWLFVAPGIFDSVPCGKLYTGQLKCDCICRGDMNADGQADASDIQAFVNCVLTPSLAGCCRCADINNDGVADAQDVMLFLIRQTSGVPCPP